MKIMILILRLLITIHFYALDLLNLISVIQYTG